MRTPSVPHGTTEAEDRHSNFYDAWVNLTLAGGRTYHFLTMPLGVTLQPEATAGEAKVRFSWTINGVLTSYKVQRDPGC